MMKKLNDEEIKKFSERPNVKKVDVENFLMKMKTYSGVPVALEILVSNAKSDKWNNETIEAALDGILSAGDLKLKDLVVEQTIK